MVLPRNPDAAREAAMSVDIGDGGGSTEAGARYIKLSPRQRTLSHLWSFFKVAEHEGKSLDWDGRPVLGPGSRDAVSRQGYIPDGYTSAEGVPRDFRRPVAQLGIVRNIISRFTGLLFSNRKQPRIAVPGDQQTEDYLSALLKQGGFFPTMTQVRNHGGAMGSGCIGFRFINGVATFEALDPRWVTPEFVGRGYTDLKKLTITYTYVKEEWDSESQKWKNVWYWYRRVIDTETDTVWAPVKCRTKMPDWDYIQRNTVRHNLGFHPYEWVQNIKDDDEADGEPDCVGCYDAVQAIDAILTQVYAGTSANCDPTLLLTTNQTLGEIKKGSDHAIRLDQGGSATYLELQGAGSRAGIEVMKELEDRVYRLAQCVPDHILFQNGGEKTATEIERIFSSMLERADSLREQYAPAMVRICQKLLTAVRIYTSVRELEDGTLVRGRIYVPPRVVQQGDGDTVEVPRSLGKGTICDVQWPEYYRPSYNDINTAIQFATSAKDSTLVSGQSIKRYVAVLLGLDPIKEIHTMKKEEEEASLDEQAATEAQGGGAAGATDPAAAGAEGEEGAPAAPTDVPESASNPATWKAALDAGIITINEYREKALGLGALPDGDLTTTQYKAKYPQIFVAATAATSPQAANMAMGQDDKKEEGQNGKPGATPGKKPTGSQQPKAGTSASQKKSAQPPKRPSNAPGGKQASPAKRSPQPASGQKAKT